MVIVNRCVNWIILIEALTYQFMHKDSESCFDSCLMLEIKSFLDVMKWTGGSEKVTTKSVGRSMRVYCTHDLTACKECCYLASTCLLQFHPQMKVVWGEVSEGVIPYMLNNNMRENFDFLLMKRCAAHILRKRNQSTFKWSRCKLLQFYNGCQNYSKVF